MKTVEFVFSDNKIQVFLSILAYCEKHKEDFNFYINDKNTVFLNRVKEIFPEIKFSRKKVKSHKIIIEINHKEPKTKIGHQTQKLFFPRLINNYIKKNKLNKIVFIGLITRQRLIYILKCAWKIDKKDFFGLLQLFFGKKEFIGRTFDIKNSKRGRKVDSKYWDESYYNILSTYRYCLCPPGDFKWTYRYYESILLGLTPIVLDPSCSSHTFGALHIMDFNLNKEIFVKDKLKKELFF